MSGKRRASYDSLAETRAAPVVDELAETREGATLTTKLALLDAAEFEITARGFANTGLDHVAARANVSLEQCSAHYPDMGTILRALNGRFVEQMTVVIDASTATGSWSGSHVREVIDIAVRSILEVVQDRQALVRAFLALAPTDPSLAAGLRSIGAHMTARLVKAVAECRDRPPPSEQAVAFSLLVGVALAHHTILVGDDWAGVKLSREELAAHTARLINSYLTSDAAGNRD